MAENRVAGLSADRLREIAGRLRGKRDERDGGAREIRRLADREGPLPLSFAQERLWFLEQLEPGSAFYNVPVLALLEGPLSIPHLALALTEVARRHESLRTTFGERDGKPFQLVGPPLADPSGIPLPRIDLSGLAEERREAELSALVARELRRPFDLARGPLLRLVLFEEGERRRKALFTLHHIVTDGWSGPILVGEIAALYAAFSAGRPSPLPPLAVQYADYAAWQRERLAGEALARQLDYWRGRLAGMPMLELPLDHPRPAVERFRGHARPVRLPGDLGRGLADLSQRAGATLFMTLLALFKTVLLRYTGQSDLAVGSPIANRSRREVEGVIGFFANTVVLRTDLSGNPTFSQLLARVREGTLAAYEHEELPFERVVEEIQPERDMSRNPLFQVMCVLQNQPRAVLPSGDLTLSRLDLELETSKFDLTFFWWEEGDEIAGLVEHNTDLFDDATIDRLYRHHGALVRAVLGDPQGRILDLPLLDEAERHQLLREWNGRAVGEGEGEEGGLVHEQVERVAAGRPDAVAVVYEGERLTYGELDARANRLAHALRRRGVGPEARVGISAERSLPMLVAALAVLKAGGALVALDPAYPWERLALIAEDARLAVLLCDASTIDHFPRHRGIALAIDSAEGLAATGDAAVGPAGPASGALPDNPMYAIYTSGSTGRPKGIVVPHRAFANLLEWQLAGSRRAPVRTVQFATFGFCVSFQEMFSAWCSGGTLVVAGEMRRRDLVALGDFLAEEGIERLHLPYAALKHLADAAVESGRPPRGLREVITAGEALKVTPSVRQLFAGLPGCTLSNQYGASETHVVCALTLAGDAAGWPDLPAVGRPIDRVHVDLLDGHLALVPVGVRGEIFAGGASVPRCYLDDPALTAWKVVPDPFGREPGGRLYRTGDLARRLPDGAIEYLGRLDGQVKVRGFRVEPGEIETVLAREGTVRDVAVVPLGAGEGLKLVAYVVPAGEAPADSGLAEDLRRALRRQVPEHMVPAAFVFLADLPVNANGKLDREALPEPADDRPHAAYRAPQTPVEEMLAGVWQEVLGVARVGLDDLFFELGGHSLLATQVVSRARSAFGVELPLRALFEAPSLAGLAGRIEELRRAGGGRPAAPPLVPRPLTGPPPASFAQERLWFLDQLSPGSAVYNMPLSLALEGKLAVPALAAALGEIARRHEALRTTFASADGRPVQVVAPALPVDLPLVDLSGLPEGRRDPEASRLAREEAARPFDLEVGPLLRAWLLRLGDERHVGLFTLHHIVADGWSLGVLVRELGELYGALLAGRTPALPELPVQYGDFALWQREWLAGGVLEEQLGWWRERLAGASAVLELPLDRPRPALPGFRGKHLEVRLPAGASRSVAELARSRQATAFMVLLAAFEAVLSRFAGAEDLVVGTPVANRERSELEGLIGFFVNTLALRGDLSGDPSFAELLGRTREMSLGAYAHQDVPFERLVEELAPSRDLSHAPLFQVMLALQNAPLGELSLPGLTLSPVVEETGVSRFDLTVSLAESEAGIVGGLEYSVELFDEATIVRLWEAFARLLGGAVERPEALLSELPVMSPDEVHQVLVAWNATEAPYEREGTIHGLFAETAARLPDAVAVVAGEEALSYGDLARRSHQLARHLGRQGVRPGDLVGLSVERSPALVVGMLGILEAGGAYVPLDPDYPAERLAFLVADAGLGVIVLDGRAGAALPPVEARRVRLDADAAAIAAEDPAPLGETAGALDLAYLVYTSGSTGRPKGVAVPHRGVLRLLRNTDYVRLGPGDRVGQAATPSFDAATFEVWGALLAGGVVAVIGREALLSPAGLAAEIRRLGIDTLFLTTALFNQVAREEPAAFAPLRDLLFGGEAVDPGAVRRVLSGGAGGPPRRLLHVYGPTECTTFATWHLVEGVEDVAPGAVTVPIGAPIANTRAYVLDRGLRPVPVGVEGELFLGGDGLAREYWRRPELTAERFVPDPAVPGERLYRTGDRVRRLPGGALEFRGRIDTQVKLRGFRIEPGEIEAALSELPEVWEAAVLVREDPAAGRSLVAYVAAPEATAAGLRAALARRLPDYMVPAHFVLLERLPTTPNGKVDRRTLLRLGLPDEPAGPVAGGDGDPVREILAGIFAEVLGRGRVEPEESFFELGGHSLLATQAVSRVRDSFGIELPLAALFEEPTVAGLAGEVAALLARGRSEAPPLVPVPRTGPLPLSFAQERLWFLDRLAPGSAVYNMPLALALEGKLAVPALAAALTAIAGRHEALRTTFAAEGGRPVQVVALPPPVRPIELPLVDLSALPEGRHEPEASRLTREEGARPFDLAAGPLLRAELLRLGQERHVVLLTLHHIVADGWSLGVLVRELGELYGALVAGRAPALPVLAVQYGDFALWQRQWLAGGVLEEQLGWWRERLAGAPAVLELPLDRPRPEVPGFRGKHLAVRLPVEVSQGVAELARARQATAFMVLLAGFEAVLGRFAGTEDLVVGTPVANRERSELEGLIGFFVNTLALRGDLSGDPTFAELLGRTREMSLGAYAHQDVPFERLVEEVAPSRDLSHAPLFQVMLALQNAPLGELSLPGLTLSPVVEETGVSRFDLTLSLSESDEGIVGGLEYSVELFDESTVERLLAAFARLLGGAVERPEALLSELPVMDPQELHQVLSEWSTGPAVDPSPPLLPEIFAAHARREPERVAALFEGAELTYGDLARRAGRLAARLQSLGVEPGDRVVLSVERSFDLLIGILGIWQAGAAFVPLDPSWPEERLAFMLEDCRPAAVVTQAALTPSVPLSRDGRGGGPPAHGLRTGGVDSDPLPDNPLPEEALEALHDPFDHVPLSRPGRGDRGEGPGPLIPTVLLDTDLPEASEDAAPPAVPLTPAHPAYVIYTSGSTGRPKGVVVPHRGLANLVAAQAPLLGLTPEDRILQFSALSFDAAVWEVAMALGSGATLVLAAREALLPGPDLVARLSRVTAVLLPPSALAALPVQPSALPGLTTLIVGGEACPPEQARRWSPGRRLINAYGPTEASVCATAALYREGGGLPLGRPLAGVETYVLDRRGLAVPPGAAGELVVGGAGLAQGYLGRPELTAERFVPHPHAARPGERLYRTGDLARHRAGGDLDFLGRLDHQVKVRGFRIELGEIEAALAARPGVREVVVVARGAGEERALVAYLLAAEGAVLEVEALREALRSFLPAYMVPGHFVVLDRFPRTPGGKLDRKALPDPLQARRDGAGSGGMAPATSLERTLAGVWARVLGVEPGLDDNFFDLGGHSLLLVRVQSELAEAGIELPLVELYRFPTLRALARHLGGESESRLAVAASPIPQAGDGVAILAAALRFPGASDLDQLWGNLVGGVESVRFWNREELAAAGVPETLLDDPRYVPARAVIDGIDLFDAPFFGFTPREAEITDPQQRLFLELAWEALERAGYAPGTFRAPAGVYAGVGTNLNGQRLSLDPELLAAVGTYQAVLGNDKDFLASRASYKLDLRGPSVNVQSACSTSLVAVHLACRALLAGECDLALAGGVSAGTSEPAGYLYEDGGILSPDGHCRAFDAAAAGTVPGQGAAVVVLKRLADALADGDPIHAVIRGTAINNDGANKVGFTAPSIEGQAEVIARAQAAAGVGPEAIGYVEAHGTGTAVGDPIEVAALSAVFGGSPGQTALGSIKSNVGHMDTAAGVAGLLKAALALERGVIPPSLHFARPNPRIPFAPGPFHVAARAEAWPRGETPRRAGVSSFGIGGTNAHAVLEEPPLPVPSGESRPVQLLVLSARTESALETARGNLARFLTEHPEVPLADAAWTLQVGRKGFAHRFAVTAGSHEEALARLAASGGGEIASPGRPVVFLFPGQGAQRLGMGRGLYETEPAFRAVVDECAALLEEPLGLDLRTVLYPETREEEAAARLGETALAQPALFVVEYALARLWMEWGVRPEALLGHSLGEYVAACLAGVFSLPDALALVALRGRLMQELPEGAMAGVPLPAAEVLSLLGPGVELAAINGAERSVVSGPVAAVEAFVERLSGRGVTCRRLAAARAFHSAMMDPILDPFAAALRTLPLAPPRIPFLSSLTGTWIRPSEATDPAYWVRHLREPVRFDAALAELLSEPARALLEVGPGRTLGGLARRHRRERVVVQPLAEEGAGQAEALAALGRLWAAGVEVDWRGFSAGERRRRVALPTYPFERSLHRLEPRAGAATTPSAGVALEPSFRPTVPPPPVEQTVLATERWSWLLLAEDEGLGRALGERLAELGHDVSWVAARDRFARFAERSWTVDPRRPEDFDRLLGDLAAAGCQPRRILHLWCLAGEGGEPDFLRLQELGFGSLLLLAQGLARRSGGSGGPPLRLDVVADALLPVAEGDRVVPAKATLLAACRLIPLEVPGVSCAVIDVAPGDAGGDGDLAGRILAEVALDLPADEVVAWRGLQRSVPSLGGMARSGGLEIAGLLAGRGARGADGAVPAAADRARPRRPDHAPPEDETQAALARIWQQLLGIEPIGIHDNFFELGGDSILAIRMAALAREGGIDLVPAQIVEHQTIAALAREVGAVPASPEPPAAAAPAPVSAPGAGRRPEILVDLTQEELDDILGAVDAL